MSILSSKKEKAPPKPRGAHEFLTKDAILLSGGKDNGPFLESALDLLSAQRPVWEPSAEELLEFNQQKTVLSMMSAIREGDRASMLTAQLPPSTKNEFPTTNQSMQQNDVLRAVSEAVMNNHSTKINYSADKEFVNLDVLGAQDGDQRVTLGVSSRAIFAKSMNAAKKLQLSVACLVACINNNSLSIVFHGSSNGSNAENSDIGNVPQCRLTSEHVDKLVNQYFIDERQCRLFASAIALQAIGYNESITESMVRSISDQYKIDYEGLLRFAISIEKWRVTENPASFFK
jgi:hypothetical protein